MDFNEKPYESMGFLVDSNDPIANHWFLDGFQLENQRKPLVF